MEDKELLTKLLTGLRTLDESEFDYAFYVTEYDHKNHCGTVCCAWGWIPRFVPESGVRWGRGTYMLTTPEFHPWKQVTRAQRDFMFLGEPKPTGYHSKREYGNDLASNLAQVCNRIEYVIGLL